VIATVINFSSNEVRFLKACLEEALLFSERVIVCFADHFFDGTEENLPLIYGAARAHPEVTFIQYPFSKANFYGDHPPSFWHSLGRMIGSRWAEESDYLKNIGRSVWQVIGTFAKRAFGQKRLKIRPFWSEATPSLTTTSCRRENGQAPII
jgi:hypothetical protein